jgi:predicted HicB family RNase H-like nuclease
MVETKTKIVLRVPPKLAKAGHQLAKKKKTDLSKLIRAMLADAVGKPELADDIKPGRPRHDDL